MGVRVETTEQPRQHFSVNLPRSSRYAIFSLSPFALGPPSSTSLPFSSLLFSTSTDYFLIRIPPHRRTDVLSSLSSFPALLTYNLPFYIQVSRSGKDGLRFSCLITAAATDGSAIFPLKQTKNAFGLFISATSHPHRHDCTIQAPFTPANFSSPLLPSCEVTACRSHSRH